MQNLLKNYKTTSAGLLMALGAIVHLVFAIKAHTADENTWTITIGAVLGGIGLIFAGDASASTTASTTNAQAIDQINQQGPDKSAPPVTPKQP